MGTSEGLPEIDGSAGTIVWVRRRNGSWWPGRILGPEELSASHLMSPRSGTPVKLLGREDASVDWYNLEKSKRVKAFRCGEFDACIERAEAVQGNPLKKREKYARREDAILHALELEKQQLQNTSQKLGFISKHMCLDNGLSENFHESDEITDAFGYHSLKADPFTKKLGPYEEEDVGNPLYLGREKYMEQHGYEGGNAENSQRMRGLQDIGLRTAYSRRKLNLPVTLVNADDIVPPNHVINSKSPSTARRKRSQTGPVEEAAVKRRDRRRPLVQVLQSSAKFPSDPSTAHDYASMSMPGEGVGAVYRAQRSQCIYSPADDYMNRVEFPPQEMQVSCLYDTKNSFLRSSEDEGSFSSGKVRTDERAEETTAGHSDLGRMLFVCDPSNSGLGVTKEQILGSEEVNESMLIYGSRPHCNEQASAVSANMRGSKWQSKGKRNARVSFKRPSEINDTNHSSTTERLTDQGAIYEDEVNMLKKRTSRRALEGRLCRRKDDPIYDYYYDDDDDDDIDDDNDNDDDDEDDDDDDDGEDDDEDEDDDEYDDEDDSDLVDGNDGSMENAFISKMHSIHDMTSDDDVTDSDGYSEPGFRGYWEESDGWFNPYYGGHFGISYNRMLVDVDLKVQVSYKREQVPLVSLMSGLNGKAIVGRPLQVEKLEDGSLQLLFPGSDIGEGALAYDDDDDDDDEAGNSGLQPVWRTARRTVMHRVPRARPSAAFGIEETDFIQYSDNENWSNSNFGSFNDKGLPSKNPDSHSQGSHSDRKILKQQSKKACLSGQKTRTLSSIASEQPVKPERSNPISCVPVKLVFSRINEAVGKVAFTQLKIPS